MRIGAVIMATLMAVEAAAAQPVSGAQAEDLLFGTRGQAIAVASDLSEFERSVLRQVIELAETRLRQPLYWYASIAYSPEIGRAHV